MAGLNANGNGGMARSLPPLGAMERKDNTKEATTLMLVDDDTDLLWLMSHALKRRGFQVRTFSHAPSLDQVRDIHPSVIFLDVDMGMESGEDVCGQIKGQADSARVPVILLSSHGMDRLKETALRCGADGYMTKPFDAERMTMLAHQYAKQRPAA